MTTEPHFWLGVLAAAMDEAIQRIRNERPEEAEDNLSAALHSFISSPCPSDELKSYMRSVTK